MTFIFKEKTIFFSFLGQNETIVTFFVVPNFPDTINEVLNDLSQFSYNQSITTEKTKFLDSFTLKICWILTIVSNLLISNFLFSFLILFDKHGEDWAKRSLFNRIVSQSSYPVIVHNLIVTPIWTARYSIIGCGLIKGEIKLQNLELDDLEIKGLSHGSYIIWFSTVL